MSVTFLILTAGMVLGGIVCAGIMALAWKRRRFAGGLFFLLLTLLMLLCAAVALLLAAGTTGYKALVREELAATVTITPLGSQQFKAEIARPDAPDTAFTIAGDELYIDARVLKWKPLLNLVGLHTAYCLDRVAGRYASLQDEKTRVRTVYSLAGGMRPWDLFSLRMQFAFLAPLLDAQYGSATFTPVQGVSTLRIMVTTSGLIARINK
jgi:hypothetical protein